jgi:hypothetical protein
MPHGLASGSDKERAGLFVSPAGRSFMFLNFHVVGVIVGFCGLAAVTRWLQCSFEAGFDLAGGLRLAIHCGVGSVSRHWKHFGGQPAPVLLFLADLLMECE